jgi:hypothetical protein
MERIGRKQVCSHGRVDLQMERMSIYYSYTSSCSVGSIDITTFRIVKFWLFKQVRKLVDHPLCFYNYLIFYQIILGGKSFFDLLAIVSFSSRFQSAGTICSLCYFGVGKRISC